MFYLFNLFLVPHRFVLFIYKYWFTLFNYISITYVHILLIMILLFVLYR